MRYRGLVFVVPAACLAMLGSPTVEAAAGAALTIPAQVQASAGANPVLSQVSFSYPEVTPFCTVGVDFTWDGAAWLSEFPSKNGTLCVASGANAKAPTGHGGAGAHQVCGNAGVQFRDCKSINVVVAAGAPAPTQAAGQPAAPTAPAAQPVPTQQPAATGPVAIVRQYPRQTATGLVLLAVGLAGLTVLFGRRLLLRGRRRRTPPLPSPGQRR